LAGRAAEGQALALLEVSERDAVVSDLRLELADLLEQARATARRVRCEIEREVVARMSGPTRSVIRGAVVATVREERVEVMHLRRSWPDLRDRVQQGFQPLDLARVGLRVGERVERACGEVGLGEAPDGALAREARATLGAERIDG